MSDSTLTEEPIEGGAASAAVLEAEGPHCEKCGVATDAAACPSCGWYPSLGIHVEVDESFETLTQAPPAEAGADAETAAPESEVQRFFAVWSGLIPGWGWAMLATTGAVILLAVVARLTTVSNPTLHTYCGVGGVIGGLVLAVLAHFTCYVLGTSEDPTVGVFDVVAKPLKLWKFQLAELPKRLWLANGANLGVSTALAAALIVGGVPYERLLDWGFTGKPEGQSLVAMIAEQAGDAPADGDLEGAIGDFADQAAGDLEGSAPEPKPLISLECVIIGYQKTDDEGLRSVLLAAGSGGRLKYVGKVYPKLDAGAERELLDKLSDSHARRPFVRNDESAVWVRPKFTCKATYTEWPEGKRPENLKWVELLDELSW